MELVNTGDFLMESDGSDFKIRVRTEQDQKEFEVPGHSFVIRRANNVLKTMLESESFKESKTNVLELKAKGDLQDGMAFLRYLYTKNLDQLDINSYVALLETAHLYDVKDLTEICEKRIRHTVSLNSVCKIYATLQKLATEEFRNFFLDLMLKCAFHIFENKLHISLQEETLKFLLESDQLNVLDERQAVTAILWWAKSRAAAKNKDENYAKSKTAELMPLVRWSFVQNSTEFDTWFNIKDSKSDEGGQSDVQRKERKSNPNFTLKKYCNVLRCADGLISVTNTELTKPIMGIQFSVNRDTLLIGLELHVESNDTFDERSSKVNIYYNGSDVVQSRQKNVIKWRQHDTDKTAVHLSIIVEFDKPLLLKHVGYNEITINFCYYFSPILGPVYKTESGMSRTFQADPDIVFTVGGDVIAIEELYYLPK